MPAEDTFELEWAPATVGKNALAAVSLKWKHVDIIHESSRLRKPISGVDVLSSKQTQNIDSNPLFLAGSHIVNDSSDDLTSEVYVVVFGRPSSSGGSGSTPATPAHTGCQATAGSSTKKKTLILQNIGQFGGTIYGVRDTNANSNIFGSSVDPATAATALESASNAIGVRAGTGSGF